jgi:hypothetical protein
MSSDSPITPRPNGDGGLPSVRRPEVGLPTVTPPTGGMFLRLFGVPALIVGGLVLLLIVAQPLIGRATRALMGRTWAGSRTPDQYLRELDDSNAEVRWRAASDLAQVLLRDDQLASNGDFALQLADRLQKTLQSSAPQEEAHARRAAGLSPEDARREVKKLEPDRNYILLLASCLGHFMVPVGTPVLEEMAGQESGLEPYALNARRRQALWALANLGENLKRFDTLPPERQEEVKAQLEVTSRSGERTTWARQALDYLTRHQEGHPDMLGVDRVVEKCADADDPSLRELAAFVLNFWTGTAAQDARMEKVLLRLSHDSGAGEDRLAGLEEENPDETRKLVKKPGFRVQVNATIALARRGSPKVRLDMLQTMLDEAELRQVFVVQAKKGGPEQPDEALVTGTVLNALKAVVELHQHRPELDLSRLKPAIDQLARDPNPAVQAEAVRAQLALGQP